MRRSCPLPLQSGAQIRTIPGRARSSASDGPALPGPVSRLYRERSCKTPTPCGCTRGRCRDICYS